MKASPMARYLIVVAIAVATCLATKTVTRSWRQKSAAEYNAAVAALRYNEPPPHPLCHPIERTYWECNRAQHVVDGLQECARAFMISSFAAIVDSVLVWILAAAYAIVAVFWAVVRLCRNRGDCISLRGRFYETKRLENGDIVILIKHQEN